MEAAEQTTRVAHKNAFAMLMSSSAANGERQQRQQQPPAGEARAGASDAGDSGAGAPGASEDGAGGEAAAGAERSLPDGRSEQACAGDKGEETRNGGGQKAGEAWCPSLFPLRTAW
jgi:hypothetical protein